MKSGKLKILKIEPGEAPFVKQISCDIESLQAEVKEESSAVLFLSVVTVREESLVHLQIGKLSTIQKNLKKFRSLQEMNQS